MSTTFFYADDCVSVLDESFAEIDVAIQQRKRAPESVTLHAEREVCIEAHSLLVAFKEFAQTRGLDEGLAVRVQGKLREALGVLSAEPNCILAVRKELEIDFSRFVNRMKTGI